MDLGLELAGLEVASCVEIDKAAVETIRLNRPNLPVFDCSITELSGKDVLKAARLKKGEVALIAGGPPCQAFSVFGNRKGIEDHRGQMVFEYIRLIDEARPKTFIMENVRGLLSMPIKPKVKGEKINDPNSQPGSLIKLIFKKFNEIGYSVDCFVVNSVNYGAPQIRERLIFIGNRFGLKANFPSPRYSNRPEDNLPAFKTLGDVIGPKFIDPIPEVMNFSRRKLDYLAMVPEGGNWRSLPIEVQKESMGKSWYLKGGRSAYWRKLSFSFPSPTVVTMPNHAGTSMCHPTELRAISVGEAAAIQEFPPEWKFSGTTAEKFKQVGNAVPTRLGRVAGECALELLKKIDKTKKHSKIILEAEIIHLRPHVRTRSFWKNGVALSGDNSYYEEDEDQPFAQQLSLEI